MLAWLSVWPRCRFAYGAADTTATLCILLQEIQIGFGFTFLVPAHPGSYRQNPESHKTVVVVVVVVLVRLYVVDISEIALRILPHSSHFCSNQNCAALFYYFDMLEHSFISF